MKPSSVKKPMSLLKGAVAACVAGLSLFAGAGVKQISSGQKLVFMGDSITDYGWSRSHGYPNLVLKGLAANGISLQKNVTAFGVGIAGEKSDDMLKRFDTDVVAKNPDVVTISAGVNDILFNNTYDFFYQNMLSMVAKAKGAGAKVILLSPTAVGYSEVTTDTLSKFVAGVREIAAAQGCAYAPVYETFRDYIDDPDSPALDSVGRRATCDSCHMAAAGDRQLARAALKGFGLDASELATAETAWNSAAVVPFVPYDGSDGGFSVSLTTTEANAISGISLLEAVARGAASLAANPSLESAASGATAVKTFNKSTGYITYKTYDQLLIAARKLGISFDEAVKCAVLRAARTSGAVTAASAPVVTVNDVLAGKDYARFDATITSVGGNASACEISVKYGTSAGALGNATTIAVGENGTFVSDAITGLSANTTYYYQLTFKNNASQTKVVSGSFKTLAATSGLVSPTGADDTKTIQSAINAAGANGTVTLAGGVFYLDGSLTLQNGVTLKGQGMTKTILHMRGAQRVAELSGNAKIMDLTVENGKGMTVAGYSASWPIGAGLLVRGGTVSGCRVWHNVIANGNGYGAGIFISKGTIQDSVIAFNALKSSSSSGAGIGNWGVSDLGAITVDHCLIYGNETKGGKGGGIGLAYNNNAIAISNTTIAGNVASGAGGGLSTGGSSKLTLNGSVVSGNAAGSGAADVDGTPASGSANNILGTAAFVDATNRDYRLVTGSASVGFYGSGTGGDNPGTDTPPSSDSGDVAGDGKLTIDSTVSDHCVLLQNANNVVKGTTAAGRTVTVTFGGKTASAKADASGSYQVTLNPGAANATGRTLTVTDGSATKSVSDVLVGEVWFVAGQSNAFNMMDPDVMSGDYATAYPNWKNQFDCPNVRVVISTPQQNIHGADYYNADPSKPLSWIVCQKSNEDNVKKISPLAFFFGKKLSEHKNCPVGIVLIGKGGTPIGFHYTAEGSALAKKYFGGDYDYGDGFSNGNNFSGCYTRTDTVAARGVIWAQGETGGGRKYRFLLQALVENWRARRNQSDLPFLIYSFANFDSGTEAEGWRMWPRVRWEQEKAVAELIPNAAVFHAIDLSGSSQKGYAKALHPDQKPELADRALLAARHLAYGEANVAYRCPYPTGAYFSSDKSKIYVTFPSSVNLTMNGAYTHIPFRVKNANIELLGECVNPTSVKIGTDKHSLEIACDTSKLTLNTAENGNLIEYCNVDGTEDTTWIYEQRIKDQNGFPMPPFSLTIANEAAEEIEVPDPDDGEDDTPSVDPTPAYVSADYYVSTTGSDSNNGTSRATAFATIKKAVSTAVAGQKICVLKGTYNVQDSSLWSYDGGVHLNKAVTLFGETGNPADVVIHNDREWADSDQCWQKIFRTVKLNDAGAVLSGVTVENGIIRFGDRNEDPKHFGANVLIDVNGGTVTNCIIRNGRADTFGNAVGSGDPGTAGGVGGIACFSQQGLITHCVITNNSSSMGRTSTNGSKALTGGGVVYMKAGTLRQSLVAYNTVTETWCGSAVYAGEATGAETLVENCTIYGNKYVQGPKIGNYNDAGQLYPVWIPYPYTTDGSKMPEIRNCVIAGNETHNGGKLLIDWTPYNVSATPSACFVNCATDMTPPTDATMITTGVTLADDLRPAAGSSLINAGATMKSPVSLDLGRITRVKGTAVDIGCYEYPDGETAPEQGSDTPGSGEGTDPEQPGTDPEQPGTSSGATGTLDGHDAVQLWTNGPYWATMNVGAEKPSDYGYYYKANDNVGKHLINGHKGSAANSGTTVWGNGWRRPTGAELDAIVANCTYEHVTLDGSECLKVSGKGDYADKYIILPIAGNTNNGGVGEDGMVGHYWSSTAGTTISGDSRHCLYIMASLFKTADNHATNYYTLRMVCDSVTPSGPVHTHNWGAATYAWTQTASGWSCTGTSTCSESGCTVGTKTKTVAGVYSVVTPATTAAAGVGRYTATFNEAPFTSVETKDVEIAKLHEHTYGGTPVYTWSADNATCTASIACDKSGCTEKLSETVTASRNVTKEPTTDETGTCVYTATFTNAKFAQQTKTETLPKLPSGPDGHGYEYVQLWTNGPYWAKANVGATSESGIGKLFSWGATTGFEKGATTAFNGGCPTMDMSVSQLQSAGYVDADGNLVKSYDAASANMGGDWRMPTKAEMDALMANCDHEPATVDGMKGMKFTGKGDFSDASIFLPAVGCYSNGGKYDTEAFNGFYSSSTVYEDATNQKLYGLNIQVSWIGVAKNLTRNNGYAIRGVLPYVPGTNPGGSGSGSEGGSETHTHTWGTPTYSWSADNASCTATVSCTGDASHRETETKASVRTVVTAATATTDGLARYTVTFAGERFATQMKDVVIPKTGSGTTDPTPGVDADVVQLWENGPYWAKNNVGAATESDYGQYFSYGSTTGAEKGSTTSFDDSCPTTAQSLADLKSAGYVDANGVLFPTYDAANAKLGGDWRMPTKEDWAALVANCTVEAETIGSVKGLRITGKGAYADRQIFLPNAGYYQNKGNVVNEGTYGFYLAATAKDNTTQAYAVNVQASKLVAGSAANRNNGYPVRPVRDTAPSSSQDDTWDVPGTTGGINALSGEDGRKYVRFSSISVVDGKLSLGLEAAKIDANGQTFGLICKESLTDKDTFTLNVTLTDDGTGSATTGALEGLTDKASLFVLGIGPAK